MEILGSASMLAEKAAHYTEDVQLRYKLRHEFCLYDSNLLEQRKSRIIFVENVKLSNHFSYLTSIHWWYEHRMSGPQYTVGYGIM